MEGAKRRFGFGSNGQDGGGTLYHRSIRLFLSSWDLSPLKRDLIHGDINHESSCLFSL